MQTFHTTFREKSIVTPISTSGKKHVALLAGGMSAEREVSLSSSKGVSKALVENGYRVTMVDMGADLGAVLLEIKPDVVFNCLHGTYGEDGCVPGLLNIMRIPYTHSGVLGSSIAFNKTKSREIFLSNNIKCAQGILIHKKDNLKTDPMERPYVIKPLNQGSSIGVEVIFAEDDFSFANYPYEYGDQVLVEKFIKGRELNVAVLNGKALGVLELKQLKNRWNDYEAKYTEGFVEHIQPANLSTSAYARVLQIAQHACELVFAGGMSRVEFIYSDEEDAFYILEINTHPGMTPLSICPDIARHNGMSFAQLVEELLKSATYEG
jgi:D-alanine-D-alanine ligase